MVGNWFFKWTTWFYETFWCYFCYSSVDPSPQLIKVWRVFNCRNVFKLYLTQQCMDVWSAFDFYLDSIDRPSTFRAYSNSIVLIRVKPWLSPSPFPNYKIAIIRLIRIGDIQLQADDNFFRWFGLYWGKYVIVIFEIKPLSGVCFFVKEEI